MTALLFDTVPEDRVRNKAQAPGTPVAGLWVYRAEVVRALLRYGTFDRYYLIHRTDWTQARQTHRLPPEFGDSSRVRILGPAEMPAIAHEPRLVLMTSGSNLFSLLPFRSRLRRPDWPICGVSHSLHGEMLGRPLLSLLLDDYDDHDALICSTRSARQVVEQQLESLRRAVMARIGVRFETRVQLPIIPLGVDVPAYQAVTREQARAHLGLAADRVVLLYVGRFSAVTKADLVPLLIAFRQVQARVPTAQLVLSGNDTQHRLAPLLAACARTLGIGEAVRIVPDPPEAEKRAWLAAADMFVAMSDNLQETYGISIAEAMAAGLPVIAADWNGFRDLVTPDRTGILVPTAATPLGAEVDVLSIAGNHLATHIFAQTTIVDLPALTRAMQTLATQPELRARFGAEARAEAARRLDWSRVIAQYEALWEAGLQRAAARATRDDANDSVLTYRYDEAFAHYPTRWLDDADDLAVAIDPATAEMIVEWSAPDDSLFSKPVLCALLGRLRDRGSMPMQALVRCAVDEGLANEFTARAHIARLVKYGLVTASPHAS